MNIQEYIASGILEFYCLGHLSGAEEKEVQFLIASNADVRNEVARIQASIEQFAEKQAIKPPAHLAGVVTGLFKNFEKEARMDAEDLPLINRFSDYSRWQSLMPESIPTNLKKERYCKLLTEKPGVMQLLVISATDFEDEVHDTLHESFLILDGNCECTVDNKVRQMKAGDFMDIPLYAHHHVALKSPYVVAILQHLTV